MYTLQEYSNRDIDAELMVNRLAAHRNVTTGTAAARISHLETLRRDAIRNYKQVDTLDHELGSLRLLIRDRNQWSDYCFDDVSHWAGVV